MREKIEAVIKKSYNDVNIWEYTETRQYTYVRFTAGETLYMATMFKGTQIIEYFKYEGRELV